MSRRLVILVALVLAAAIGISPSAAQDEQITLVFSNWHLGESQWEPVLNEAIAAFEAEHPNIDVVPEVVAYAERDVKYITEIEAGAGPDVIKIHNISFRNFIENGYLLDLTPFIEAEGEGFLDQWYGDAIELLQWEGGTYLLPGEFMTMVLIYNRDLFEAAGLDPDTPPATWEDLLAAAKQLTRDTDGDGQVDTWGIGLIGAVNPGFELRFMPFMTGFGAQILNDENTCSALNAPEALAGFEFFTDLVTEHQVVPPGITSADPAVVRQMFANQQIAIKVGSGWTLPIVSRLNPEITWSDVLQSAEIPVPAGSEPEFTTTAWLSGYGINRNTEHPEEAWEFLKFITSTEWEQRWFDDARVTSARLDVSGLGEGGGGYEPLLNDPIAKSMVNVMPQSRFVPQIPEWPRVIEAMNVAAQEVFTGAATAEQALENAHNMINDILSERRGDATCEPFRG